MYIYIYIYIYTYICPKGAEEPAAEGAQERRREGVDGLLVGVRLHVRRVV